MTCEPPASAPVPANAHAPGVLGVLGGMGPAAGAYFAFRLALLTDAARDQDHLPVILRNDPRIPDRSNAVVSNGPSPLDAMRRGLRFLESSGCAAAVIPCNTAHLWFDELQGATRMPLLHIVEAVVATLNARGIGSGALGVLGTPGTLRSTLYRAALARAGFSLIELSPGELRAWCTEPIQAVKQNRVADAQVALLKAASALKARGAAAVVLACTELPVALAAADCSQLGMPMIDSIDALVISALNHFGLRALAHGHQMGSGLATRPVRGE